MRAFKLLSALSAAVIAVGIMSIPSSAETNPFTNKYFTLKTQDKYGFAFVDGVLTKTDENGTFGYTGKVKIDGEAKFYDNGIMWTGWRKLGGKWYCFDPESGVMAKDKVKTALGTYYLDENGAWNGKVSKSALCPEDFDFKMSQFTAMSDIWGYEIDTANGLLKVPGTYSDDTRSISLSKRDMQIFYDVIMSCGLTEADADLTGYGIIKRLPPDPEALYMESDDTPVYASAFTMNGASFEIKADYDMFQFYGQNEDVRNFAYFRAFADRYVKFLPEYAELTEIHEAAIHEYVAAYND